MNTNPNKANDIPAASGSGCDTRSKAQAMAEPRPMDKWVKGRSTRIIRTNDGEMVSYWLNDRMSKDGYQFLPTFLRWCREAEFLGGANA